MADESPWQHAQRVALALAPAAGLVANPDMVGLGRSLGRAARGAAAHPGKTAAALSRYLTKLAPIPVVAAAAWWGTPLPPPVTVDPKDRRFGDSTWQANPAFYGLRLAYLAMSELSADLLDVAGLDRETRAKAELTLGLLRDALAPTNFLLSNPAALKKAFETGGRSLVDGSRNFLDDVAHNRGRPRQVDTSSFVLGENMAATPSKVVFRNEMMELLQYEPQTPSTHAAPMLCSPPWINKYYVMDLAPGRSFIEWAVQHDHTVFAISYRNPTPEMSQVTMDDYLLKGLRQSLDVIQDITGASTIDIVGLCLGGALTAVAAAYLVDAGDSRVGNLTLLNTLLDYAEPGPLGAFTDERTVSRLEAKMAKEGGLAGSAMAGTFDILRANDLIFNYVVSNWLMGQQPPAFDILAWNADATRMPAVMHAFYLRNFYLENRLARNELEIAGRTVRLGEIKQDAYVVGAENDHIVPWRSAYQATSLLAGAVRFVLSSGGHIAGIVNPPGPKGWYLVGEQSPPTAQAWREQAIKATGSWWEDWAVWARERSGELSSPPPMGSERFPVLSDGPGRYIHS